MSILFTLLLLVAFILLIIGFFRPSAALFWRNSGATRARSAFFYSIIILMCFICIGVTAPDTKLKESGQFDEKASTSSGKVMSDKERRIRKLVRSCDTTYTIGSGYSYFDNDTAYAYENTSNGFGSPNYDSDFHLLPPDRWTIPTRKRTGPDVYDYDYKRPLTIYKPLHVLSDMPDFKRMLRNEIVPVSPFGSTDTFLVALGNLTLKNPDQCSLVQKIKNGFYTLASFIPTSDPDKRPTSQNEGGKWVTLSPGTIVVVLEYNEPYHEYTGKIYDAKGKLESVDYIDFAESTLIERK